MMTPMGGYVYLTKSLRYAIIYCIGGDILGNKVPLDWIKESRYGYVFKSAGVLESNLSPDEDEIGELIHNQTIPELNYFAKSNLTERQYKMIMNGEYAYWASGGKKLNKILPTSLKQKILNASTHAAHLGKVKIIEAWRFDKTKCEELKHDGSNFFQLAEKVLQYSYLK